MTDIDFHCNEKDNFGHGYSVRAFSYTDYSIPLHSHDFYEINIILSGVGSHCIENCQFKVSIGDVYIIPPNVAHAYCDTENLEVYHILLKQDFVNSNREESNSVAGFLKLMEIEPFLRSNFEKSLFVNLSPTQMRIMKSDIAIIDDFGSYGWSTHHALKYHTVWKILYWLSGILNEQSNELKIRNKYEFQILKSLEFIHSNYHEKITVDLLCKKAFLSRSTFLRYFEKMSGVSPVEYLNRYRCQKALELLENSNSSKTEIAHLCGFYDLSHMNKTIKSLK